MPTATVQLSAVVLPDRSPGQFVREVAAVEAAGLRGAWTYDHLSWRDLRDQSWHAAVPLLAAAAGATSGLRLGLLVSSPNFRHPVPFAKEVMTLDHLCDGRVELGIGAGGTGADATVLGAPPLSPAARADRFAAFTELLDLLLRGGPDGSGSVTASRPGYDAVDARMLPGCVQRPRVPLTVAATGPRGLILAATVGEGWVTYGPVEASTGEAWYAAVGAQSARLDRACAAVGRAPDSLRRTCLISLDDHWQAADPEFGDRMRDLGFDEVAVHWPRSDGRGLTVSELETVGRQLV